MTTLTKTAPATVIIPPIPENWIARSAIIIKDGLLPYCIVVRDSGSQYHPFVCHRACVGENDKGEPEWNYMYGNYSSTREGAMKYFEERTAGWP